MSHRVSTTVVCDGCGAEGEGCLDLGHREDRFLVVQAEGIPDNWEVGPPQRYSSRRIFCPGCQGPSVA